MVSTEPQGICQRAGGKARVPAVPVHERMNEDEPMVEPNADLRGAERLLFDPERRIA
jgi:hypothetical protein